MSFGAGMSAAEPAALESVQAVRLRALLADMPQSVVRQILLLQRILARAALHIVAGQTGSFLNMAPEVVLGERYNETAVSVAID